MDEALKPVDLLQVQAPDKAIHGPGIADLICKVFSSEGRYFADLGQVERVLGDPRNHLDWRASRVALDPDGEILGNFTVWDYRTNVGRARLRTGGIGCVCCHGDWRKKGVVTRVTESSICAMEERGYDISILFGIPDFYHRFGYVRAWSENSYELKRDELKDCPSPGNLRRFAFASDDEAARLYNRTHGRLAGTARRPTYRKHFDGAYPAYGWRDEAGALLGYLRAKVNDDKDELLCIEAVGDIDELKGAVHQMAKARSCRKIRLISLPERHPLLIDLRRGNCKATIEYARRAEAMIRIINLGSCLRKMEKELSARLTASELAKWRGELLIDQHGERVLLKIGRGMVKVQAVDSSCARNLARIFGEAPPAELTRLTGPFRHVLRGGDHIAQLILGSDDPFEIVEAGSLRLKGDAKRLLPVLFPNLQPNLSAWDRY